MSIRDLFIKSYQSFPDSIAISMGDNQWTYAELHFQSDRLVEQLKTIGVQQGDIVAISFNRGFEQIVCLLALLKMNVAYLPLDADYPTERLRYMLDQSKTKLLLTQEKYISLFSDLNVFIATIKFQNEIGMQLNSAQKISLFDQKYRQNLPLNWSRIIYVLYTSGSTGKPKGIAMGESSLENMIMLQNQQTFLRQDSVTLQFSPLGFDVHFQEIFSTWSMGGELVLISEEDKRNPTALLQLIDKKKINRIHMPYVAIKSLCEAANRLNFYPQSIREITAGGEQLKINDALRIFFSKVPHCVLFNHYGPTETHLVTTLRLGSKAEGSDPMSWPDLPSIGYPVGDYNLLVLDEKMQALKNGEVGELYIGGVCLAYGYLHSSQLTAERFIQHPQFGLIYKTGDLCKYNQDGQINFYGRIDTQVKVRGYRVEIAEVETAINNCIGVSQCLVKLHSDDEGSVLCAYIKAQKDFDISSVKNQIALILPDYMVPSLYVLIDKVPMTPSGKLDYKSLPSPFAQRPILNVEFVACSTDLELKIEKIWKRYLLIDKIGVFDSFFDLGGHSLLLVKVLLDLNEVFQCSLTLADLFSALNISQLAKLVQIKSIENKKQNLSQVRAPSKREINTASNLGSDANNSINRDIAVIAVNARFAQADNIEQFWQLLVDNLNAISKFSLSELHPSVENEDRLSKQYVFASGEVNDADSFDYDFFGINKQEAEGMDPQQRKFLELSYQTFELAGYDTLKMKNNRIGVFASMGPSKYSQIVSMHPDKAKMLGDHYLQMGLEKDYLATKIAYKLNLNGPAVNINTACSSSLVSIIEAVQSLRNGQCDMALAGGVSIRSTPKSGHLHNEGGILSSSNQCRPFDKEADGTLFTDGLGLVVLKRLSDAQKDGDYIWSVIKGVGLNNDGSQKMNYMAPSLEGQTQVIAQALSDADVSAESISYVEAHGTATPVGDPIEFEALKNVYERFTDQKNYCVLSSVKSNIGHANSAAGIAGFLKAVLSLHYDIIPGTVHFNKINPNINIDDSPFVVTNKNIRFPKTQKIHRAAVSSFGVGGTNAHVVLEKYIQQPHVVCAQTPTTIFRFSSKTLKHFEMFKPSWMHYFNNAEMSQWQKIAYTLHIGRYQYQKRCALIVNQHKQEWLPKTGLNESFRDSKLALVFPGQGSQYRNMAAQLYNSTPLFRTIFDQLVDRVQPLTQKNIRKMFFSDQAETHDLEESQPMLFIFEFALAKYILTLGFNVDVILGHSLGEFAAATLAGVFEFEDVYRLLEYRARLIKELPKGQMLSIAANREEVLEIIKYDMDLDIAAENSPRSVVVSGSELSISKLKQKLNSLSIAFMHIASSHAFHSRMMSDIRIPLIEFLKSINLKKPQMQIVSTISLSSLSFDSVEYWAEHLLKPVDFNRCIQKIINESKIKAQSIVFLEVGPKRGLTMMIKKIASQFSQTHVHAIPLLSDQADEENWSLHKSIAELWVYGIDSKNPELFYSVSDRFRLPVVPTVFEKNNVSLPWITKTNPELREDIDMSVSMSNEKTQIVNQLADLFSKATGLKIGLAEAEVSFFEMGMDSLFLTQAALLVNKQWKVNVSFRMLMEKISNLSRLADYIIEQDKQLKPAAMIQQQIIDVKLTTNKTATSADHKIKPTQAVNHNISLKSPVESDAIASIVSQQLEIMRSQLALLQNGAEQISTKSVFTKSTQVFGAGARIILNKSLSLSEEQKIKVSIFANKYNQKTRSSKLFTENTRSQHADPRAVTGFRPETKEFVYPIVVEKSLNQYLWDLDGNRYIDMTCGFGSNFFGNGNARIKKAMLEQIEQGIEIGPQHPLTADVSKLLCELTGHERAAFCNTGSEAVVGAIRIARTVSGKNQIVIFSGSYHGIADEMIARGQADGEAYPAAAGIPPEAVAQVKVLDFGLMESLSYIDQHADKIAAVLVEPVQSRRSSFQPKEFIKKLRSLTLEKDICLIFDEIITGFRIHEKGAQGFYGVQADVCTYGKIVGGGMPVGMIAGQKKYMDALDGGAWNYGDQSSPEVGVTYFAGTFVRHPLALAASKAALEILKEGGSDLISDLNQKAKQFIDQVNTLFLDLQFPMTMDYCGSLMKPRWTSDLPAAELFFAALRYHGVHTYDGFPWFVNLAHTSLDLKDVLNSIRQSILTMQELGLVQIKSDTKMNDTHIFDSVRPPVGGAKLGKDLDGNPAWFVENENGTYTQV